MNEETSWQKIAKYLQLTPSPHNTQPYRLKVIDDNVAEVVFIPSRGLYVGDPKGRFTWLTAGIFVELGSIVAHSLGFEIDANFDFSPMYPNGDHETPQIIARLTLISAEKPIDDLNAGLILQRHTSRLPYDGKPVPGHVIEELKGEASRRGHTFNISTDPKDIEWIKTLNKNSLFYDLENKGIREELKGWLRYSKREAQQKKDGLSAECLRMPGALLHSFFYHHKAWMLPGLKQLVDKVYLSTMKGIGTIGWMQGPYVTLDDWVNAGRTMIRMWLILTSHGIYWHPYGSVITNDKSRTEMLKHLGLPDEKSGQNMIWLLLRMGYSQPPPQSERLPIEEILI